MNFVAHLFLAPCNDAFRVGALLADFTVGKMPQLEDRFGSDIAKGIQHHREIDRFTDSHRTVNHCVDLLKDDFGIYGGIVVDVAFDHFLLRHWQQFSPLSKEAFFSSIYQSLTLKHPEFPQRFQTVVQRMLDRRWLRTYENIENVAYALKRVGERFSRPTPLADTLPGLQKNYSALNDGFLLFFPDLLHFSNLCVQRIQSGSLQSARG